MPFGPGCFDRVAAVNPIQADCLLELLGDKARGATAISDAFRPADSGSTVAQGTIPQGLLALVADEIVFVEPNRSMMGNAKKGLSRQIVVQVANVLSFSSRAGSNLMVLETREGTFGFFMPNKGLFKGDREQWPRLVVDAARRLDVVQVAPASVADELAKLVSLRDAGVLTAAEFDSQKARLLGT